MLTIILLIILAPILIGLGTMFAQFISMILMMLSVGLGSLVHRLFAGKSKHKWEAPAYIPTAQLIIIMGFVYAVYANVIGGVFKWHWLLSIGSGLDHLFGVLLILDMVVLVALSTIHGSFEVFES